MRFTETKTFHINELLLDEGNYRFRGASDQKECIEKIYRASPAAFRDIMESVAEDDLGELLLVYRTDSGEHIVQDGNRRTAALKVLEHPEYAPNTGVKRKAEELASKFQIDFQNILAQVSSNQTLILKTIYERHGSTGGKTRIQWPAIAKSRFAYDNDQELGDAEWKAIALLFKLEELDPDLTEFFESNKYKHDIFRRLINPGISLDVIPGIIFSDRDRKIKVSQMAKVRAVARVCKVIFEDMERGVLSLSRTKEGSFYPDAEGAVEYLRKFVPENEEGQSNDESENSDQQSESETDTTSVDDGGGEADEQNGGSSTTPDSQTSQSRQTNNGVSESAALRAAILNTGSRKFEQLYASICTVSLVQHPSLVMMGGWALIESMASALGKDGSTSIDSYFSRGFIGREFPNKFSSSLARDFHNSIESIRKDANGIKHSPTYRADSALNLRAHFDTIEPLLLAVLEKIVADGIRIR